jgi:hypothetical protein
MLSYYSSTAIEDCNCTAKVLNTQKDTLMTRKEYEKKLDEVKRKLARRQKLNKVEERIWAYRNVGRCNCQR